MGKPGFQSVLTAKASEGKCDLIKQGLPVLDLEKRSGKSKGEVREGCLKLADKAERSPAPANSEITSLFPKGYFSRYLEGSILSLPPRTQSPPQGHPLSC